jgi:glutaredoxin
MKLKIFFIFLFILISSIVIIGCSKGPGQYDSFAKCLTEKGAAMYGTEWCSHCRNQKKMFGDSFQYVYYVDCDRNRDECLRAGVRGYPTWVIDGELYPGEQQLFRLASLSGCEL